MHAPSPPEPQQSRDQRKTSSVFREGDWVTWGVIAACVLVYACAMMLPAGWGWTQWGLLVFALTLHSSLSHEILHGGPLTHAGAGTLLGIIQPGLFVPYLRFKVLHLAHHRDAKLTDPYDDPETNYLDPEVWEGLAPWRQRILRLNNTLLGRMVIGPVIGIVAFIRADLASVRKGEREIAWHWIAHLPGVVLTLWWVSLSSVTIWSYFAACYGALSVLRIRTFLEHQAHERASGRSVIIEDRGVLAFLFLNNNFHAVHHKHPTVAWHQLPALYLSRKERFIERNQGYIYRSYGQVFAKYFLRAKDSVAHPLWQNPRD